MWTSERFTETLTANILFQAEEERGLDFFKKGR